MPVIPDIKGSVVIQHDGENIPGNAAVDIADTNSGAMSMGTVVKINYPAGIAATTSKIVDIQASGASQFVVGATGLVWCSAITEKVQAMGSISGSQTIDWNQGGLVSASISGDVSLSFLNVGAGKSIKVAIIGDSNHSVTWTGVMWSGGVQPSQTHGKLDVYTFICFDGVNVAGSVVQNIS